MPISTRRSSPRWTPRRRRRRRRPIDGEPISTPRSSPRWTSRRRRRSSERRSIRRSRMPISTTRSSPRWTSQAAQTKLETAAIAAFAAAARQRHGRRYVGRSRMPISTRRRPIRDRPGGADRSRGGRHAALDAQAAQTKIERRPIRRSRMPISTRRSSPRWTSRRRRRSSRRLPSRRWKTRRRRRRSERRSIRRSRMPISTSDARHRAGRFQVDGTGADELARSPRARFAGELEPFQAALVEDRNGGRYGRRLADINEKVVAAVDAGGQTAPPAAPSPRARSTWPMASSLLPPNGAVDDGDRGCRCQRKVVTAGRPGVTDEARGGGHRGRWTSQAAAFEDGRRLDRRRRRGQCRYQRRRSSPRWRPQAAQASSDVAADRQRSRMALRSLP